MPDPTDPRAAQEPTCTGVKDKDGNILFLGDRIRYRNEGRHTKKEYWNPEYEIIWKAPSFTLKHVGGGKDAGSYDFMLRCGGGNGDLELVKRGPHAAPPPACQQEAGADLAAARAEIERLTKERDEALARLAGAFEVAARWHDDNAAYDQSGIDYSDAVGIPISNHRELEQSVKTHTYSAREIRALTPDDAKAALQSMRADAERDMRQRAADSCLGLMTAQSARKFILALPLKHADREGGK